MATPKNRIHGITRWPADLAERIDKASTDIGFADAMSKIMGCDEELHRIANTAFCVLVDTKNELAARERR